MSTTNIDIVENRIQVLDKRYEIKIPVPEISTPEIETWIRLHPEQWRVAYPPRQVNNIYFDTYNSMNFYDNLNGVLNRHKLRIRWYGNNLKCVEKSQFEVKHKVGLMGWKNIVPILGVLQLSSDSWHQIVTYLKDNVASISLLFMRYPSPAVINSYYRKYYTSADGHLRLTLDTQLQSFDQRLSSFPNISRRSAPQPYTIVEIKTHPDNAGQLAEALSHTISRVTRFSKYVNAVKASVFR
jgi:hypothetical protein